MASLPYMQFYPADYLADTAHLTTEQHGAYFMLLLNYWQRGKPLKDDDERLASVVKLPVDRWLKIRPILEEFFNIERGEWEHARLERDLNSAQTKSEKASAAGKASGRSRKKGENEQLFEVGSVEAESIVESNDEPLRKDNTREDKKKKEKKNNLTIPEFIDPELFEGYEEMRNKIKKPLTERGAKGLIKRLIEFHNQGYDANSILETAIIHCWQDVYVNDKTPKRKIKYVVDDRPFEEVWPEFANAK